MTLESLHWLTPHYIFVPLVLALIAIVWRGRAISFELNPVPGSKSFKHPLLKLIPKKHRSPKQKKQQWLLLGWLWVMLSITLAQPVRLGEKLPDLPPERDIVLLVDISISMTLKDYEYQGVKISRLDVLKNLLHKFVGRLEGERLAMIVFAETPHLLIPLTRDQTLIQNQLVRLKSSMAGRISALGDAIILGLKEASKQPQRKQIFVVFTDVDESIGRVTPKAAAQLASQSGIPLYNIAIGSTVKSSDISGENTNKKAHNEGLLYQTVNLDLLKSLSVITSGNSYEVGDALAIENALRDIQRQQKNEAEQEPRYAQEVLYPYFLLAGIIPLIVWQLFIISGMSGRLSRYLHQKNVNLISNNNNRLKRDKT